MRLLLLFLSCFISITYGSNKQLKELDAKKTEREKYALEIKALCDELGQTPPQEDEELFSTLLILFKTIDQSVGKLTRITSTIKPVLNQNNKELDHNKLKRSKTIDSSDQLKKIVLFLFIFFTKSNEIKTRIMPIEEENNDLEVAQTTQDFLEEMIQHLFEEPEINK
jgi:hypothetical protein